MDGELDTSPDVQILADDDVHTGSDDHDRDDDDDGLEIKPPQQHGSKKDRHRHKHKEDRKKMRVRERPREEKGKMKDRDKQGRPVVRAPPTREPVREPVRDAAYAGDVPREDAEARRREKSIKERERLENLERERHRLERERSKREQQHREKMRRDKERQRAQERAQRKREAARRAAPPAQSVQEKRSEKRYDRPKPPPEHARSRSRSPLVQRRSGREEKLSRREYSNERSRSRQHSPREPVSRAAHEEFETDMAEGPQEPPAPRRPRPPHTPEGPPPPDDNDEASASGQSGSESDDSGDSESDSHSSSGSEHRDEEHERKPGDGHKSHEKLRSKFDNSDNESEGHSVHQSDGEQDDYVVRTPPSSPPILLPDLPPYYPAIQGCRNVEEFNCLNRIEEGTYGVVFRALDKKTKEIVALKKLKMEKEKEGFPITSLREINTLLKSQHINIVTVREIVVGSNMDKIYIVMDYVEHDLKSLMETMKDRFVTGEVKTLMMQLLRGVAHLHDNWIIHRDLKTSNLLLSHKGILKIGDFGLAREYGSPLKQYTPIVVTLWYRSPELLLGTKEYSTAVDMWSVGCIFAEFLTSKPLFPGKSDIDQLNRIFKELGTPNEKIWPGVGELPAMKKCTFTEFPYNQLRNRFGSTLTDKGFDLLNRFLTYNPERRITAEEALGHEYFSELPLPIDPSYFPTWPAKSEQPRKGASSPKPPSGGKAFSKLLGDDDSITGFHLRGSSKTAPEFALKF